MNVFELTRALVDIESITNNEERVGTLPLRLPHAARRAVRRRASRRIEVEPRRFNIFVQWGEPLIVTLSTHIDTVPPFIASREDDTYIWGRGACDTKGIIAAMIKAVEALLAGGHRDFGLLFVVGEERNSAGAYRAAQTRADRATSSTASPPKTTSPSAARACCATKSPPPARWPTPPTPNSAIRPSINSSMRSPISAASRCPSTNCSGRAR